MNLNRDSKRWISFCNYQKQKHLNLLKLKYIEKKDLTWEQSKELLRYSVILFGHLCWEDREYYLELLEKFVKGKIENFDFCIKLGEKLRFIDDLTEILESKFFLFSPHPKSFEFSEFIDEISEDSQIHLENRQNLGDAGMNPKADDIDFRNLIEKKYLQLQEFLEK